MQLNPYLLFDGQCEAAFKFYEKCLGGKIVAKVTYGESPMAKDTPPGRHNKILHARLMVGDNVLMGSDAPQLRRRHRTNQCLQATLAHCDDEFWLTTIPRICSGATPKMARQSMLKMSLKALSPGPPFPPPSQYIR